MLHASGAIAVRRPQILFRGCINTARTSQVRSFALPARRIIGSNTPPPPRIENPSVLTWGAGHLGTLGHGTYQGRCPPRAIEMFEGKRVVSLHSSWASCMAVTEDGCLYRWGWKPYLRSMMFAGRFSLRFPNLMHFLQQIPLGWLTFRSGRNSPAKIEPFGQKGMRAIQAESGAEHHVVLTEDGAVYSWGGGTFGQLGLAGGITKSFKAAPHRVTALEGQKIVQIACGFNHTLALNDKGQVFSWGKGNSGALGILRYGHKSMKQKLCFLPTNIKDDNQDFLTTPIEEDPRLILERDDFGRAAQIAAGFQHSVILNDQGKLFTFGRNHIGALGFADRGVDRFGPKYLETPEPVCQVASGDYHNLFLTPSNNVYTFGVSRHGQCGRSIKEAANYQSLLQHPSNAQELEDLSGVNAPRDVPPIFQMGKVVFYNRKNEIVTPQVARLFASIHDSTVIAENGDAFACGGHFGGADFPSFRQIFSSRKVYGVHSGWLHCMALVGPSKTVASSDVNSSNQAAQSS